MKKTILATAIISLYAPTIFAQDADATQADETMVVTANRFEQPKASTLANISVIEREDIQAIQADSALDVLKTLPGVEVTQLGTKGNTTSIYLRGTASAQTLILVDGVRINSPTSGGGSIGLIPAFAIEKIEVLRGPKASIYGADAVGGVISITTISKDNVNQASLTGGSNYYHSEGWRSSGDISDDTRGSFVVNNEVSKGYAISSFNPDNEDYGYKSQVAFGSLQHDITDNWSTNFSGYNQSSTSEFQSTTKDETRTDFYSVAGGVNYHVTNFQSSLQVSQTNNELGTRDVAKTRAEAILEAKRNTVSWINSYQVLDSLNLTGGVDYYQEKVDRGGSNSANYQKTDRNNTGIFATSSLNLEPVIVEASIRNDNDSSFGSNTTWNLAAGVNIGDSLVASVSHGTAYRAPTFNDMYWPEDAFSKGNPDLNPEKSESTELSLQGFHSWASWTISAYQTNIKDMIEWAPDLSDPQGKWQPSNVSKAEIRGIEASVEFDTWLIHHTVSADWKDPKNKETGLQLANRAKQNYSWIGTLEWQDLQTSLVTNYVGERPDSSTAGANMMGSYITVDLALKYSFTENLDARFKVSNLLDEDYEISKDTNSFTSTEYFKGAERGYYAGIDYRF
ncbi:TonB-dependent receptor domain-containing protein [Vibrio ezurae]|uniref:Vitamin B12 transporter BtuB n=1 Tax=Vibrio ezurae NBRC 102218 TaxID=1219080 RepID=U3AJI9_9VIBR|nr:TonB-dependent receptor [Vibrio ezurae]GAD80096.1 vitamin B12 transporter BtuB [Vibrio ezurae NBRC 102218]